MNRRVETTRFAIDFSSLEFIDKAVERWRRIVLPIIGHGKAGGGTYTSFGTCFVASYKELFFLVTAAHVVRDMSAYSSCFTSYGGIAFGLDIESFLLDDSNDIAVTYLGDVLVAGGLERANAIDLVPDTEGFEPSGDELLIGYPSTKNKIDVRWGRYGNNILSMTSHRLADVSKVKTAIADPMFYLFDPKDQWDSYFNRIGNAPDPHGMSGGPVIGMLLGISPGDGSPVIRPRLNGVIVEQRRTEKLIVAASVTAIVRLLEDHAFEPAAPEAGST